LARRIIWRTDRGTTADLRRRFVALDPAIVDKFRQYLLENWANEQYWDSDVGRHDLDEHAGGRLI
jgi:S-adenosylmethionine-dependent methyltransferase